ncbi:MAG: hypothetical protein N2383_12185 [Caldilineales bacterium]|nr:hypothetical protein [Caldilineales bacterium]
MINRALQLEGVDAISGGQGGLGVEVNQEGAIAFGGKHRAHVDDGRRLANTAFLIGNSDDSGHGRSGGMRWRHRSSSSVFRLGLAPMPGMEDRSRMAKKNSIKRAFRE